MNSTPQSFLVRDATDADSASLLRLVDSPVVARGVRWTIDRESDFFTPFRAEAGGWWVVIAEEEGTGTPVGCVSIAVRNAYVDGRVQPTCYVSNLLVRPDFRGRGIGDELCRHGADLCRSAVGSQGPILLAIHDGNPHMHRRIPGPRGLPGLRPIAKVRIHSIRTHELRKATGPDSFEIQSATPDDLGEMTALSRRVFPARQFAPAFNRDSLARWIEGAPGLTLSDHLVAREGDTIVGWLGLWDESVIRRVRVAGYSRAATLRHALHNSLTPITGTPRVPGVGDVVDCAVIVHVCVPADRPDVLRAVLRYAAGLRPTGSSWLRIALDPRDGLADAVAGLRTHVSSFGAYVATPTGAYAEPMLKDRPVHFEAALA
jgi:predicted N-acetyltransferase YhbS